MYTYTTNDISNFENGGENNSTDMRRYLYNQAEMLFVKKGDCDTSYNESKGQDHRPITKNNALLEV